MPFLTIFTAPKPFNNPHVAMIQRNAIRSWIELGNDVEVFLIGEEDGLTETAEALGARHLQGVLRNEQDTPLVSSIFAMARQGSNSPMLVYVNADILLLPDFLAGVRQIAEQVDRFLMVGQRWDLDVNASLGFSPGWVERLCDELERRGSLHPPAGSDYFAFPKSCFTEIPDFAIGRAGWDNWMIFHARQQGIFTIDATSSVTAIHQSHDYSHLPGGKAHYRLEESETNRRMAGGKVHMYNLLDADKKLVKGKVGPVDMTLPRLIRRLELAIYPKQGEIKGIRRVVRIALRRLWRSMVSL